MRIFYCQLLLLLFFNFANGQDNLNDYIKFKPSVPEATQIQQYGDYSPPNSFGIVPINLPITNLQTGKFEIPITINYSAGAGIRVNERSSVVGLGWNLSALDNYVEIMVQGSGQDFGEVYDPYLDYQEIENRYKVNNQDSIWLLNSQLKSNALSANFSDNDYVADKINYNFLGKTGAIITDGSGDYRAVTSSQNDLEIIKHSYNDIEIIDGNGNHYIFNREIIYSPSDDVKAVRKRLYLTKIVLYNGGEINYNYSDTDPNSDSYYSKSWMRTVMFEESLENAGSVLQVSDFTPPYSQFSSSNIIANNNTLKEIVFANGKVVFSYANSGAFLLKTIKVYDKDAKLVEHYNINNNTTYKNSSGEDVDAKLTSITKITTEGSSYNLYEFNYNSNPIPTRYSTKGDYWGYNNGYITTVPAFSYFYGNTEYNFQGDNRSPNYNATKAGILKEIIYPSGGKSTFYYEPNYYSVKEPVTSGSNPINKNISLTAIGQNPLVSSYTPIDSTSFYIERNNVYSTGGISVNFVSSRFTKNSTQYPYYKIIAPDGTIYTRVFNRENEKHSDNFNITNVLTGTYKVIAYVGDASLYPNDPQPSIFNTASLELSLSWVEYSEDQPPQYQDVLVQGGGVRIKKIENYTDYTSNTAAKILNFEYGETQINGIGVGEFLGLKNQSSIIPNVNTNTAGENHILTNFLTNKDIEDRRWYLTGTGSQGYFVGVYRGYGVQLSSDPVIPIEYKGHSVFYPKVTIYNSESKNDLGYKEQYFVRPELIEVTDVMGDFSTSNSAQVELAKYSDYSGVHLIKEIVFNSYNDTVSLKEYDYQKYLVYEKPVLKIKSSDKTLTYSNTGGAGIVAYPVEIADMTKTNVKTFYFKEKIYQEKLVSTNEKSYFNTENIESHTVFTYVNNKSFRVTKERIIDSEGREISEIFSFPDQVLNNNSLGYTPLTTAQLSGYNNLTAQNIHRLNKPIQIEKTVKLTDNTLLPSSIQRTYYGVYQNKLMPSLIYTAQKNGVLEPKLEVNSYDVNGNYLNVEKPGGLSVVYLWGYNDQYPIAKIENATSSDVSNALGISNLGDVTEADMSLINGLRTALPDAMVTTYTYEPLVGMTSMTDARGQTTHYEYDAASRLKAVFDSEQQLLKEYKYNYRTNN